MKTATTTIFLAVPAGTKPSICRGSTCNRSFYWIRTNKGPKPISCDVEGGQKPSEAKDVGQLDLMGGEAEVHEGRGVLHHTVCPDVGEFARRDH